ncbi:hypothetical protein PISMIDRAFT_339703 [Pisolithus microcarpus 441]|uniref:Uncharacterized protein n=1 Tax=Pisolithus microcarpus 441 TaxID=765257 RepID=A0A0C9ZHT0_9AGAM|nr:hypothetical protein PISMIDRAFT_339703 [Pisolithus microcarpus 441]
MRAREIAKVLHEGRHRCMSLGGDIAQRRCEERCDGIYDYAFYPGSFCCGTGLSGRNVTYVCSLVKI